MVLDKKQSPFFNFNKNGRWLSCGFGAGDQLFIFSFKKPINSQKHHLKQAIYCIDFMQWGTFGDISYKTPHCIITYNLNWYLLFDRS